MIDNIIKDLENKLDKKIDKDKIEFFNDGVSGSIVFKYDKYLVKTVDIKELKSYIEFFNIYNKEYFQKIICYSEELLYICFNYIEGELYKNNPLDPKNVISQLYNIVSNYKEYKSDSYGYLQEEHFSWHDFLMNEAYREEDILDIDYSKLFNSFQIIEKYDAPKYLIHGDFGAHNFIVNNNRLYAIDPIPLVGDYLYDFYFAIFTNVDIFKDVDTEYILRFFNREIEYKKALMIICFYIRLRRTSKYNKNDIPIYIEYLNRI